MGNDFVTKAHHGTVSFERENAAGRLEGIRHLDREKLLLRLAYKWKSLP